MCALVCHDVQRTEEADRSINEGSQDLVSIPRSVPGMEEYGDLTVEFRNRHMALLK